INPIPPWRAIAIARRESVTVSIAAATMGIFSGTLRARQVRVSACVGSTEDLPGSSRTSSNVSPSGMAPSIINFSWGFVFCVAQKKTPINNSAQPDSLGSNAIQLSHLTLMIKKAILGASRDEIKKLAQPVELRDQRRLPTMDAMKEFVPSRWLRNPHAMTIAATFWRRKYSRLPASTSRLFEVEPGTQVRSECHMQENPRDHT